MIEDITIRHTVLLTWEHKRIVIPNEKLDKITVVNYSMTDPRMLLRLEFSVSYDTDIDLARRLILDEVMKCPHRLDSSHAFGNPTVRVVEHADFCIKLRAYLWTANIDESWYGRFWLLSMSKKDLTRKGWKYPSPIGPWSTKTIFPPPDGRTFKKSNVPRNPRLPMKRSPALRPLSSASRSRWDQKKTNPA